MKRIGKILALTMVVFSSFAGVASVFAPTPVHAQAVVNYGENTGQENLNLQFNSSLDTRGNTEANFDPNICPHWYSFGCQMGVLIFYDIWFSITQRFAKLTAYVADYTLNLSLQSWVYHNSDFIITGWTIMRDIANIAFIGGLLYAAFRLMMGDGTGKKLVAKVVIFALLINFSLFFTRVVVDGGNILARSIYQSISVSGAQGAANDTGVIEISAGIVNISNPQRIIFGEAAPVLPSDRNFLPIFYFISFVGGIINVMMIFMFISMALLFVGRTVGLMLLMIMVPLTVLSEVIPPIKSKMPVKYLTLDGWMDELWGLTLTAPVYIFFLYLIVLFWESTANGAALRIQNPNADWMSQMMILMIPMLLTFFLLKAAGEATKKLAGEIGGMISGATGAAVGAVAGLAMSATALGANRLAGAAGTGLQRLGANAAKGEVRRKELLDKKDRTDEENAELNKLNRFNGLGTKAGRTIGNQMMMLGTKTKKQNFDARNLTIGGMNMGNQLQAAGLGGYNGMGGLNSVSGPVQGGFKEMAEKKAAAEAERIKEQSELIREAINNKARNAKVNVDNYENGPEADKAKKKKEDEEKALRGGDKGDVDVSLRANDILSGKDGEITNLNNKVEELKAKVKADEDAIKAEQKKIKDFEELAKISPLTASDAAAKAAAEAERDARQASLATNKQGLEDAKKAKEDKIVAATNTLSIDDLETAEKNAKRDKNTELEAIIQREKTTRTRKADKLKKAIDDGTFLEDDAKTYTDAQEKTAKLAAEKAKIEKDLADGVIDQAARDKAVTNNDALAAKEQKKIAEIEKGKSDAEVKEFKKYADDKKTITDTKKEADKYVKQFQKQEIDKLTESGKQWGMAILKGLGAAILTGMPGVGFGLGLVPGAIAGVGAAVQSSQFEHLLARFDHLFMDNGYKATVREKLRGSK